jgi:hypothetical protein
MMSLLGKVGFSCLFYFKWLSTRQKSQEPVELFKLVFDIEQDMADEIKAVSEQGFERSPEGFLKGIGCC